MNFKPWMMATAMLVGCDGNGGTVSTGLDSDRTLDSLSTAEAVQACVAIAKASNESVQSSINDVTALVQECTGETTSLFDDFMSEITCDSAELLESASTCKATVGEFEACLNAGLDAVTQAVAGLTCDDLSSDNFSDLDFPTGSIPACTTLEEKCPELGTTMVTVVDQ